MPEYLPQDPAENSLWGATAIDNPVEDRLRESLRADVLVVGGGYTGLSSALHLAEQGVDVVLLEARSIGFGGSGRNAGLVNAGVWKDPRHVKRQLGDDMGERFYLALRDSPALVFDLIERFSMNCDAHRGGTVHIAHSTAAMKTLEDRCRQLQALGAGVELIDGPAAARISASPCYRYGGILDPGAGTIHPLNYVRSLALAALGAGARIFQDSAITGLEPVQDRWLAKTADGEVSAERVILATNAYADRNNPEVRASTVPVFIFQCASEPLEPELAERVIPGRQGLWDTQILMTSSRLDSAGRLVMSSAGRLAGYQRAPRENWMTRNRNRLFPQARGLRWEYYWSGQVGVTDSKILRVQSLGPGIYAPAGYNGRGIGPGTVIGRHLAEALVRDDLRDFPFPVEAVHHEPWRELRAAYYNFGTLALQIADRRGSGTAGRAARSGN
ncbi:MAG TPA: FAD-binding oxidoreductase [Gammaproteobacteria bacterium]|nr:FAD-binding oxidoreductase [Gammaproteobacteria bacterium]